jgi:hypothetical protein
MHCNYILEIPQFPTNFSAKLQSKRVCLLFIQCVGVFVNQMVWQLDFD